MDAFNVEDTVSIPTINGWVMLMKRFVPAKYVEKIPLPLLCIVLGIAYTVLLKPGPCPIGQKIVLGIMLGGTAAGGHAAIRKTAKIAKGAMSKKEAAVPNPPQP